LKGRSEQSDSVLLLVVMTFVTHGDCVARTWSFGYLVGSSDGEKKLVKRLTRGSSEDYMLWQSVRAELE
jgi:hypothetical protein